MLYQRWRQIVRENGDELALRDSVGGRQWTFRQLDAIAERGSSESGAVVYPRGICAEFILRVLRAWRTGQAVCPVEAGQTRPQFSHVPAGCVHLKTTSATSGAPRVIAFTAEQLMADADNIVATMGLRREEPNLGVISLAHSYGFSNLVSPLLLHGIPLILSDSPLPEAVRRAAAGAGSLTLPAVPALWRAWHEAQAIPPGVRLAISAGAPLPLALEQAVFEATRIKLHNFYGASECGGIAYDASTLPRNDPTCAGTPLRNVQVSVNADDCLEVRSRAVGETYWPDPQPDLAAGVYRTSDLAELKDGQVFLRGRASDMINVAGRKVSPETIERVLLAHPEVRECLVFGAPSPEAERSEIVVACLAVKSPVTAEGLKHFLLSHLPAWQVPREWVFVESLPTGSRGKLSRAEWRRKHARMSR
ncbi:MAG TPA: fatty acid--CoA ligase family protein [Haliangiales bacterium]|nr:fatty acid--CoA ligase family protein [Haliangiales bacterium]